MRNTTQVYDVSDTAVLTREEGVSLTISAPKVAFAVQQGQQALCGFVYSTLALDIPYVYTAYLDFDGDGGSSYTWSVQGKYATASYTEMDTVVTISSPAALPGARLAGAWQPPYEAASCRMSPAAATACCCASTKSRCSTMRMQQLFRHVLA
jgi:hypothetical protein